MAVYSAPAAEAAGRSNMALLLLLSSGGMSRMVGWDSSDGLVEGWLRVEEEEWEGLGL